MEKVVHGTLMLTLIFSTASCFTSRDKRFFKPKSGTLGILSPEVENCASAAGVQKVWTQPPSPKHTIGTETPLESKSSEEAKISPMENSRCRKVVLLVQS